MAYGGTDAKVLRSSGSSGRAYVPERAAAVGSEQAGLARIQASGFEPGRDAVVEGGRARAGVGSVRVAEDAPERVALRADLSRGGLVVLNDSLRDGWSVAVDGRDARPRRVNSVVRGVVVPSGRHTVTWSYRVPGLRAGLILFGLGLVAAGGWAFALRRP